MFSMPVTASRVAGTVSLLYLCWLGTSLAVATLPAVVGWQPVAIRSGSMAPHLRVGDVVVAAPTARSDLRPGQVVVVPDPADAGGLLTHRLVRRTADGTWVTRGDANRTDDSTPVLPDEVVGTCRFVVPVVGLLAVWFHSGSPALAAVLVVTVVAWLLVPGAWAGPTAAGRGPAAFLVHAGSAGLPSRRSGDYRSEDTTWAITSSSIRRASAKSRRSS